MGCKYPLSASPLRNSAGKLTPPKEDSVDEVEAADMVAHGLGHACLGEQDDAIIIRAQAGCSEEKVEIIIL